MYFVEQLPIYFVSTLMNIYFQDEVYANCKTLNWRNKIEGLLNILKSHTNTTLVKFD